MVIWRRATRVLLFFTAFETAVQRASNLKLERLKVGGTTYTSAEAMQRFAEGLGPPATLSELPYSLARQREIERAAHEVNEMLGIRS